MAAMHAVRFSHIYTDAPALNRSPVLGALRLVMWLLVHPSAWRNYVAQADPTLGTDFALASLGQQQWRNPALRRAILIGCVVWPLLLATPAFAAMSIAGAPARDILVTLLFSLAMTASIGLWLSWSVSVVFGGIIVASAVVVIAADRMNVMALTLIITIVVGMLSGLAAASSAHSAAIHMAVRVGKAGRGVILIALMAALIGGITFAFILNFPSLRSGADGGLPLGLALGYMACAPLNITLATTITRRIRRWYITLLMSVAVIVASLVIGAVLQTGQGVLLGVTYGIVTALAYALLFGVPYVVAERADSRRIVLGLGALGIAAFYVVFALFIPRYPAWLYVAAGLISTVIGLTVRWWQSLLFYPFTLIWNGILYRMDQRQARSGPSLLHWHSAFWDEHQQLPLFGLPEHLVLVTERDLAEGQAALHYLIGSRQAWAAHAAQIELDVRRLERCGDVQAIAEVHHALAAAESAEPASVLIGSFGRVSVDVAASLKHINVYQKRLALTNVADHLISLIGELTRSQAAAAVRLLSVASRWRQILKDYLLQLSESVETSQELDNPYVVGVPLTEQQKIFVGRTDISARIEQLLLDQRRPPLLLWGQRRMGKTSLLRNLGRLLPSSTLPMFVDGEAVSGAADYADLLYNMAREMGKSAREQRNLSLPRLSRAALAANPFTYFNEWLDAVEKTLDTGQYTALLALDEFEALGNVLNKGRFDDEDILRMLRHLMQHRPKFKVLLASSHSVDEFQHWSSYLINMQVVKLSYLSELDTRQLIEHPVPGFGLHYEPEAARRVYVLTRGHPTLVQLLCYEIVELKNEQDPGVRRLATLADVEDAVPRALGSGRFIFADMQQNQIDSNGVALLRILAMHGESAVVPRSTLMSRCPDNFDHTVDLLLRRDVIESVGEAYRPTVQARSTWRSQRVPPSQLGEGYRFQVELVRRWFAKG
ncbi:MAG: ATP-binding protein [Chloroflexi bacterium]|nr:ATP-binding protein [Chloroflexota bacterium]